MNIDRTEVMSADELTKKHGLSPLIKNTDDRPEWRKKKSGLPVGVVNHSKDDTKVTAEIRYFGKTIYLGTYPKTNGGILNAENAYLTAYDLIYRQGYDWRGVKELVMREFGAINVRKKTSEYPHVQIKDGRIISTVYAVNKVHYVGTFEDEYEASICAQKFKEELIKDPKKDPKELIKVIRSEINWLLPHKK